MNNIFILLGIFAILYCLTNTMKSEPKLRPFSGNIEELTLNNKNYRQVLSTTTNLQLVLMSLLPGQDIGAEVHPHTSQFIRVESGQGVAVIEGKKYRMNDGDVVVVPAGANHNIINLSHNDRLQLYAIYSPPEHPPNTLQLTKPKEEHH